MTDDFGGAFTSKVAPDASGAALFSHISDAHLNPHVQYRLKATQITTTDIADGTIATVDIADSAITSIKIADGTITGTDLDASVAGAGLVGAGGIPLAVGAGTGITVNADDVALSIPQRELLKASRRVPTTNRSTSSGTAVDWPVIDTNAVFFTKVGGSGVTDLFVEIIGSAYHNTVGGAIAYGVSCNGTDYMNGFFYFNAASTHAMMMGYELITFLAAGSYNIMTRAYTNTGTVTTDGQDRWSLIIREVPS